RYLVENAGRLIPKNELIKAVWPNITVTDESLTRCVSDVRLALGDTDQRVIRTVPRRGYLFAAPVSTIVPENSPTSALPPDEFVVKPGESSAEPSCDMPARRRLSLVVLPFVNLSGDPAQDCSADVITEGLTAYLSRIRDSFVIARTTAFAY